MCLYSGYLALKSSQHLYTDPDLRTRTPVNQEPRSNMAVNDAGSLTLQQLDVCSKEDSGSCTLTLLELKYPATEKRRKNRNRGEKTNKRKHLLFYGNYHQGEISQGVYLQTEEDVNEYSPEDESTDSPFDDECFEDDYLYLSNWKRGCQLCRSVAKRTKPKIKPHQKVKAADKNKSIKTKQNVSDNACARKDNIQKKLDRVNLVRFGYEIYQRRCAAIEGNKVTNRSTPPLKTSLKRRRHPKEMVDHPNALKYELKSDNINKGEGAHMNKIAELQHRDITPEDFELLLILDASVAPKTVSTNFLQSLTVIVVEEAKILGELCSICMELYQASEKAKRLPCNHMFHVNCIDNWLSNASPNCPLDGVSVEA